jgi:FtsH-binding integral membrane protein
MEHTHESPTVAVAHNLLAKSFGWMAIGLLISAVTTFIVAVGLGNSEALFNILLGNQFVFLGLIVIELVLVWYLSRHIETMSIRTAKLAFIGYAILNGITLSVIFFTYQLVSILGIFVGTTVMFGLLSWYGMTTKKDLTAAGKIAFFGLIGLIIASLVNIFIGGTMLDLVIGWVGVIVFSVLTAYKVQRIQNMGATLTTSDQVDRVSIISALSLYLSFINLFLSLLRIGGRRR